MFKLPDSDMQQRPNVFIEDFVSYCVADTYLQYRKMCLWQTARTEKTSPELKQTNLNTYYIKTAIRTTQNDYKYHKKDK